MPSPTIAVWRPFADFGRRVRAVFKRPHLSPAAEFGGTAYLDDAAHAHWPNAADLHYFDSELRIAFTCLLLMKGGPLDNRHVCAGRAVEIYVLLKDWVQSNGGHAGLEQRLARLRWHLDASSDIDVPGTSEGTG